MMIIVSAENFEVSKFTTFKSTVGPAHFINQNTKIEKAISYAISYEVDPCLDIKIQIFSPFPSRKINYYEWITNPLNLKGTIKTRLSNTAMSISEIIDYMNKIKYHVEQIENNSTKY